MAGQSAWHSSYQPVCHEWSAEMLLEFGGGSLTSRTIGRCEPPAGWLWGVSCPRTGCILTMLMPCQCVVRCKNVEPSRLRGSNGGKQDFKGGLKEYQPKMFDNLCFMTLHICFLPSVTEKCIPCLVNHAQWNVASRNVLWGEKFFRQIKN